MNVESFLFQSRLTAKYAANTAPGSHPAQNSIANVFYVPVFQDFDKIAADHGYQKRTALREPASADQRPKSESGDVELDQEPQIASLPTHTTSDKPKAIRIASHLPIASSQPGRRSLSSSASGAIRLVDPPPSRDWDWILKVPRIKDIPCTVSSGGEEPGSKSRERVLIYFHANAEDILVISQNMETQASYLGVQRWVTQDDRSLCRVSRLQHLPRWPNWRVCDSRRRLRVRFLDQNHRSWSSSDLHCGQITRNILRNQFGSTQACRMCCSHQPFHFIEGKIVDKLECNS